MFAASAVGAIVGTLAAGFIFISYFGTTLTMVAITTIYLMTAFIVWLYCRPSGLELGFACLVSLFSFGLAIASLSLQRVCDRESNYFCIRVVDIAASPSEPVNMMVLDHLVHGTAAKNRPDIMFTDYAAMLDHLALERNKGEDFKSFLIGGGTFSLPRKWAELDLSSDITVAEIDPQVTEIAQEKFWFDASTIRVLIQDARIALNKSDEQFDVIVGDAFTDIAVPAHLISLEFFELVKGRLTEDGIYLMNVIDHMGNFKVVGSLIKTLRQVFPEVEVWTEMQQSAVGERLVLVLVAGKTPSQIDQFMAPSPTPKQFAALSATWVDQLARTKGAMVLTDDFAPIDRLMGLGR